MSRCITAWHLARNVHQDIHVELPGLDSVKNLEKQDP